MARETIFAVDDEDENLEFMQEIIESAGYHGVCHSDGATAVKEMSAAPPVMVFLDVQMPRMNGFQVLKAMREDERLADTKVVLLSAIGAVAGEDFTPEIIEERYGVRPDAFLAKPMGADAILAQIAELTAGA